jgi:flagellar basal-body rod protein FlgF
MHIAMFSAANGMRTLEERQAVLANNVANASTPGFRRQHCIPKGFHTLYLDKRGTVARYDRNAAPGGGTKDIATFTDATAGPIQKTGNPLDLALIGPGFFVVDTGQGEQFTRNGRFSIDSGGMLINEHGHRLQSAAGGPLEVRGGPVGIGPDGAVRVGGQPVGQLRLVEFEDIHMLARQGDSLWLGSPESQRRSAAAANTRIESEAIEGANVQLPLEIASMTIALRAYQANQLVITATDDTVGKLIDQVGMPI